jgi:hypothetical protein
MKAKSVTLSNPRTGEVWVCENFDNRRRVDGVDFVEVHRPDNQRLVWMNLANLVKVKESKSSKMLEMNSKR